MKSLIFTFRYLILVPILGCIVVAVGVMLVGIGRMVTATTKFIETDFAFTSKNTKSLTLAAVEVIDLFLIATISLIVAHGLYQVFLPQQGNSENTIPDDPGSNHLLSKLVGFLIPALIIAFLGHVATGDDIEDMLYLGGGIALVIASLSLYLKSVGKF